MLFSRCSASNGGGLVPSCKLQTFHNMVLAAGKTGPTGFDCVCFFPCAFRVAAQNSNANTKISSVRYARLLACRSVDVVSFFSYRYDSFINTTNALHATCLHKQRSSTTNPLPPRFHHVRRHSIHTDNVALAMFRRCLNPSGATGAFSCTRTVDECPLFSSATTAFHRLSLSAACTMLSAYSQPSYPSSRQNMTISTCPAAAASLGTLSQPLSLGVD